MQAHSQTYISFLEEKWLQLKTPKHLAKQWSS